MKKLTKCISVNKIFIKQLSELRKHFKGFTGARIVRDAVEYFYKLTFKK